jgi:hypothetical protein
MARKEALRRRGELARHPDLRKEALRRRGEPARHPDYRRLLGRVQNLEDITLHLHRLVDDMRGRLDKIERKNGRSQRSSR